MKTSMIFRPAAFLVFLLLAAAPARAQKSPKRLTVFPFPVLYYAPETRLAGGVAGVATFRLRPDSVTARPSSITAGAAYTQNRQLLLYTSFAVFYDSARWYGFGEAGYYKYSYKFFGIGQKETPEVFYGVDYPRIRLNAARRVKPRLYAGLSYQYEDYRIVDTAVAGPLADDAIPGNRGSRTSGAGPLLIWDSRDSVLFPSRGMFVTASAVFNGPALGGDRRFARYVLDAALYRPVFGKAVLALNGYGSFVAGDAPFQQQSLLGGNKRMRGYYEGRFIDRHLTVLQSELRFPVWRRLGAVAFGGVAALGNDARILRFGELKAAAGVGLRFTVVRRDHLNLRLDYAVGPGTSGFYFTVGEAF